MRDEFGFDDDAKTTHFTTGQAVKIHPGTDLWMRGGRTGRVDKISTKWVHVRLDFFNKVVKVAPHLLATDR
jgi:hypothetical protein